EARLYSVSPSGGFMLVVERSGGAMERFTLTSGDRDALSVAIEVAARTSARRFSHGCRFRARGHRVRAASHAPIGGRLRAARGVARRRWVGGGRALCADDRHDVLHLVWRVAVHDVHTRTERPGGRA